MAFATYKHIHISWHIIFIYGYLLRRPNSGSKKFSDTHHPRHLSKAFLKTIGWFQIDSFLWRQPMNQHANHCLVCWGTSRFQTQLDTEPHPFVSLLFLWPPQWLWAWRLQCWPRWPCIKAQLMTFSDFRIKDLFPRNLNHPSKCIKIRLLKYVACHPGQIGTSGTYGKIYPCQFRSQRSWFGFHSSIVIDESCSKCMIRLPYPEKYPPQSLGSLVSWVVAASLDKAPATFFFFLGGGGAENKPQGDCF